MNMLRNVIRLLLVGLTLSIFGVTTSHAANKVLKIGHIGVMSGPAASWGLINKYAALAGAEIINEDGGFEIGGEKYDIEIVSLDTKQDPRVAIAGTERLVYQEGIKYIIGPNVDDTTRAVLPVLEKAGAFNICYGWHRELFTAPSKNTALGMIAGYQSAPVIYKYLKEQKGVKSLACVPRNDASGLNSRDSCVEAANQLGIKITSSDSTYEPNTSDFFPIMGRIIGQKPDLIVLSGVAPSDAPLLIRAARELGYKGLMSTETAMDANIIKEVAGEMANGFVSVGGASAPELRTDAMKRFIDRYSKVAGEWNDEAGTKVYALEMLLQTLRVAGAAALDDVELFKAAIPKVNAEDPFIKGSEARLKWVGQSYFDQLRQVSTPMVVTDFKDTDFVTLFIGYVE
ncbi:MAG TPA: branched-chain amino acid ABC transporter substrate-binding protein [Gammaproteobacteria bacterium]|jgi:branched-chain amino acid transport system substrate-binding protein|nr:branched-chain amino acid ABC transporter substrate-binding protein [Gammaproteobacteria bacterium]|tara:strand:+ start:559 stop:1758 length:1200 start_codon:yes stop_codon:yes gene_type:complete